MKQKNIATYSQALIRLTATPLFQQPAKCQTFTASSVESRSDSFWLSMSNETSIFFRLGELLGIGRLFQSFGTVPIEIFLVFMGALSCQLLGYDGYIKLYDEGIILYGSERVFNGDIPYRDFWTMYGPAQFYLTALLYKIFGVSDIVPRGIGLISKSLITACGYRMIIIFAPRINALVGSFWILCLLMNARNDCFPIFPAIALSMLSIIFIHYGLKQGRAYILVAGLFTGLATTFRHDIGAYGAISVILIIFFYQKTELRRQYGYKKALMDIFTYILGISILVIPVATALIFNVSTADLYENLIEIPAKIYPVTRNLPFPDVYEFFRGKSEPSLANLFEISVYLPFLVSIWFGGAEVYYISQQKKNHSFSPLEGDWLLIPFLILTSLAFSLKGLVRVSTIMMVQSSILSVILVSIGIARINWRSKVQSMFFFPAIAVIVILLLFPFQETRWRIMSGIEKLSLGNSDFINRCLNPIMPRLVCVSADPDYIETAKYIQQNSATNDRIYVGTDRHDRIFANAIALYFMAERQSVTKWHELHPGIQTSFRIQKVMIQEMQRTPPRYLVLDSRWNNSDEPNASRLSSGITILDEYIRTNFAETQRFGTVVIMEPVLLHKAQSFPQ